MTKTYTKPVKAWAVADRTGRISHSFAKVPFLFANWRFATSWAKDEKPIRVRVVDDSAVERAISFLRIVRSEINYVGERECNHIIRELGGKP